MGHVQRTVQCTIHAGRTCIISFRSVCRAEAVLSLSGARTALGVLFFLILCKPLSVCEQSCRDRHCVPYMAPHLTVVVPGRDAHQARVSVQQRCERLKIREEIGRHFHVFLQRFRMHSRSLGLQYRTSLVESNGWIGEAALCTRMHSARRNTINSATLSTYVSHSASSSEQQTIRKSSIPPTLACVRGDIRKDCFLARSIRVCPQRHFMYNQNFQMS